MFSGCDMLSNDPYNRKDKNKFSGYDANNQLRPKISKASFFQMTGYDFCWLLLEPIDIAGSDEDEAELAKRFSPGQKALYFWWYLDAQVTNGGFIQFYYNGYDVYVPAILEGLKHIGDEQMAELVIATHKIYQDNLSVFDSARKKDLFDGDLYDRLEDLARLDSNYYTFNSQTMSVIEKYARQNPNEFCVDENGKSFEKGATGKFTTTYDNGVIKEEFDLVNGVIDGQFKVYYPTGLIKSSNTYVQGEQIGEQKSWYKNGNVKTLTTIDSTSQTKKKEYFYENKQLSKLEYIDGNGDRTGDYEEWYENGQLKEKSTFASKTERTGDWIKFWEDGGRQLEAESKDGKIYFHNYWNEKGEHLLKNGTGVHITEFELGGLSKSVYRYETEYKNYKKDGLSKSYVNGVVSLTQEFKDGVEHGLTQSFDDKGKLKEERVFDSGKLISTKASEK